MRATFTQEQSDLEKTVRSVAEGERAHARHCLEHGWSAPASDAGLLRDFAVLGVPEADGGVGSSLVDLMIAVEALGRWAVPSRLSVHAAAVQALVGSDVDLEPALEGREVWALAVDEPGVSGWAGLADRADAPAAKTLVPDIGADAVVALGTDGARLVDAAGCDWTSRESLDEARPLADVVVTGAARASGPTQAEGPLRSALVVAAELCGLTQGALALAGDHARSRQQFGRVIGSFQGVAFQLADVAVAGKAAWDLTVHAAWAVENGRPDAAIQAHAAKAAAGKAAVFAAERCIQVHGGMGITREADPHLYLRRAFVLDATLGAGSWHRRRVGELRIAATAPRP
ncbi:acyl-CoA dehydrogenase family protein [Nocardioides sp. R-C-SC26]|uniref:acyl-CoA dehydrogenase family protein n=1 Tax=Nocardioides sp. R-C-SC26 TaxID=2870414 RepID=UPI001E56D1CF|nr:acyl-CoA dehydrogenase family protein [Nocardioides sp. R-C-SC26]